MRNAAAALMVLALSGAGAGAEPVRTAAEAAAIAATQCTPTKFQARHLPWRALLKGETWIASLGKPDAWNCPLAGAEISRADGSIICTICIAAEAGRRRGPRAEPGQPGN